MKNFFAVFFAIVFILPCAIGSVACKKEFSVVGKTYVCKSLELENISFPEGSEPTEDQIKFFRDGIFSNLSKRPIKFDKTFVYIGKEDNSGNIDWGDDDSAYTSQTNVFENPTFMYYNVYKTYMFFYLDAKHITQVDPMIAFGIDSSKVSSVTYSIKLKENELDVILTQKSDIEGQMAGYDLHATYKLQK